jgi:hypothetical protein
MILVTEKIIQKSYHVHGFSGNFTPLSFHILSSEEIFILHRKTHNLIELCVEKED